MITLLSIIAAVLAVARVTRVLVEDRISLAARRKLILWAGTESNWAYLATCRWCVSFWVALVLVPPAVLWPSRGLLAAYGVLAASHLTGLLARQEN